MTRIRCARSSFAIPDGKGRKKSRLRIWDLTVIRKYIMEESILGDYIDDEGQRLQFVYDYMTDRAFFIEMKELITGKNLKDPVCTLSLGKAPEQNVDLDEFEARVEAKAATAQSMDDIDEDFYGSTEFNEDEFDAAGFDEMNFDEKF